ncbi:MAG: hypothetical protein HC769_06495 [Cyanobacteria bacterium CRU_2_1]|nr:hypothetical protein [Cyanobacteria bacterium RU_5_0]NJR58472.1 hypothetical protein [Cyanobacteria bacterium CRU_2_1]NJR58530.1 hypothetical protein [Cyanobacteria bacterium CRU_2_1]
MAEQLMPQIVSEADDPIKQGNHLSCCCTDSCCFTQASISSVATVLISLSCIARFHKRSDTDGYAQALRRLIPDATFIVVFDLGDCRGDTVLPVN